MAVPVPRDCDACALQLLTEIEKQTAPAKQDESCALM